MLAPGEVRGLEPGRELRRLGRVVGQQEARRLERVPDASGGVEPRRDHERDRLEVDAGRRRRPARSRIAASPGSGAVRRRSSPSRAIARFSPRIGATSATVPIVASSASVEGALRSAGDIGQDELGDLERDAAAGEPRDPGRPSRAGAG